MAIPSNNKKGAFHLAHRLSNGMNDTAEHVGVHGKTNHRALAEKQAEKRLRKRDKNRVRVGSPTHSKVNKDGYFTLQQVMGLTDDVAHNKPFSKVGRAADLLRGASGDEAYQRSVLPEYDDWVSWLNEDPEGARSAISDLFLKSDVTDRNENLELLGVLGNLANKSYPRVDGEAPQTFGPMHDLLQYLKDYEKDTIEPKPTGSTYEIYRTPMRAQPIYDEQGNIVDWSYDGAEPVSDNIYDSDIFQFDLPEGKKIEDLLPYISKTVSANSEDMVPFSDVLPISEMDYDDPDPIANYRIKDVLGKLHDYAQVKDIRNANAYDDAISDINYINQFADNLSGDKLYDMGLGVMRDALRKVDDTSEISKSPFGWEILNIARNHANARKAKGIPASTEQEKLEDILLDKYQFGKMQDALHGDNDVLGVSDGTLDHLPAGGGYGRVDRVSDAMRARNTLMDVDDIAGFPIYDSDSWENFARHLGRTLSSRARDIDGTGERNVTEKDKQKAVKSMARLIRMMADGKVNVEDARAMAAHSMDYGATVDDVLEYMKGNPNFANDLERADQHIHLYNTKADMPAVNENDAYSVTNARIRNARDDDFVKDHMTSITPVELLRDVAAGHGGAKEKTKAVQHVNPYAVQHMDVPEAPGKLDDTIGDYIEKAIKDAMVDIPESQKKAEAPRVRRQVLDGIAKEIKGMAGGGDIRDVFQKWLNGHKIGTNIKDYTADGALSPEQQEAIDNTLTRLPDRYKEEVAEPEVGDVLRGRYLDDSELASTLDNWSKWRESTLPSRVDDLMKSGGYKPYQRSIVEDMVRKQDAATRGYLEREAKELNTKYIARRDRGKELAQTMKDRRLQGIVDDILNDNAAILQYEDPRKALEALDHFTDKAGTLRRIGNEYYKITGIDRDGNVQWTGVDRDEVESAVNKLREGLDDDDRAVFDEKWGDLVDNGRLNLGDVSSYLNKSHEARRLATLGKARAKYTKGDKTKEELRQEKNQQAVRNTASESDNMFLQGVDKLAKADPETYGKYLNSSLSGNGYGANEYMRGIEALARSNPDKYGKYLSEAKGSRLAKDILSKELADRAGQTIKRSKKRQDASDAEKEKERNEAFRQFAEQRRIDDARAREYFNTRQEYEQRNNEMKDRANAIYNPETEKRANPERVSQEVANLSYNNKVAKDEAQAESDKKAKQAEAKKQADEAKRATKEAEKQESQARAAEHTNQPPSQIQQQAKEAVNARKQAKEQAEQAERAKTEALADEHRKAVNALVAAGFSRERAEAMINGQGDAVEPKAPAAGMKNDAKPEEIKKEDNGIDKTVADTMENLSRGY